MKPIKERIEKYNKNLIAKQRALEKYNKSCSNINQKIRETKSAISDLESRINSLETKLLSEMLMKKGISISEISKAVENGTFDVSVSESRNENGAICSTENNETEKETEDEISNSRKTVGGA